MKEFGIVFTLLNPSYCATLAPVITFHKEKVLKV
jgi:hypothetical protein